MLGAQWKVPVSLTINDKSFSHLDLIKLRRIDPANYGKPGQPDFSEGDEVSCVLKLLIKRVDLLVSCMVISLLILHVQQQKIFQH